jgi:hypothetical protein
MGLVRRSGLAVQHQRGGSTSTWRRARCLTSGTSTWVVPILSPSGRTTCITCRPCWSDSSGSARALEPARRSVG